jgi:hypothetical protein
MLNKNKKGYAIKVSSGMIGAALFMGSLILLDQEKIILAAIVGLIAMLLISIAFFPLIRSEKI